MRNLLRLAAVTGVSLAAAVSLAGPAAAATSATANPNSGLQDQQTITVTASGFPANTTLNVLECKRGATSSADCEGLTNDATVSSDVNGNYTNSAYTVYVLPDNIIKNPSIKCDANNPCDLLVSPNYNDFTQPKAFAPISFATAATTTTVPATTTTVPGQLAPATTPQSLVPLGAAALAGLGVIGYAARRRSGKTIA